MKTEKKRDKERYYLMEIKENLVSDTIQVNEVLFFNSEKIKAIDSCFVELSSPETPGNRMAAIGLRFNVLGSYRFFLPNDLGFSNMMSSDNVELIRNDSIRRLLSVYYNYDFRGTSQKRTVDITRSFVEYVDPLMATKERYRRFRNIELEIPSFTDIDIYKDPKVYSYLDLMSVTIDHQDGLLKYKKKEIALLLKKINKELGFDQ